MRTKIVPISNIARLTDAANALVHRSNGMPGMGLVEGQTGFGKTTAVTWLAIRLNGVFVRARATTTPSSLLESICNELGIGKRQGNANAVEDIVQRLAETRRPLFIDEADYLVTKRMLIETLRDIHDLAEVPVVLIGMHKFRTKLSGLKQLTGRIAQWVEFEPSTLADAQLLANELAEVKVHADLVRKLHEAASGEVRRMVVGLGRIEQFARARGLDAIGAAEWPTNADFFIGSAPQPKKAALASVG